jgi:rod shape-determining protein MreC
MRSVPGRYRGARPPGNRAGRTAAVLCVIGIAIAVLARGASQGPWSAPLVRSIQGLLSPVQSVASSTARTLEGYWAGWFSGPRREQHIRRLETDIWTLRLENERLRARSEKADRLERLMNVAVERRTPPVVADVVAWLPSRFNDSITIAAGADRRLRVEQAVRTDTGLTGKIVAVGPRSSRVRLLTDPDSRVSAKVVRRRTLVSQGILVGEGRERPILLRQLKPESDLQAGDLVVTFGDGGVFPPDLPIGIVDSVSLSPSRIEKIAVVRPLAAPPGDLREVIVVPRNTDPDPTPQVRRP